DLSPHEQVRDPEGKRGGVRIPGNGALDGTATAEQCDSLLFPFDRRLLLLLPAAHHRSLGPDFRRSSANTAVLSRRHDAVVRIAFRRRIQRRSVEADHPRPLERRRSQPRRDAVSLRKEGPMSSVQKEIGALEERLRLAELGPDPKFYEEALADDAVLVSQNGQPSMAKSKVIEAHQP